MNLTIAKISIVLWPLTALLLLSFFLHIEFSVINFEYDSPGSITVGMIYYLVTYMVAFAALPVVLRALGAASYVPTQSVRFAGGITLILLVIARCIGFVLNHLDCGKMCVNTIMPYDSEVVTIWVVAIGLLAANLFITRILFTLGK